MAHALEDLIESLRRLPGVGLKSAQRMAYHLLQHDRAGAQVLAQALMAATQQVGHCQRCYTLSEQSICSICLDASRDSKLLCVVESPTDMAALERTGSYLGRYFVLMGRVNPLEGLGATDLGITQLAARLDDPALEELILATSFTAQGEATAQLIALNAKAKGLKTTRLARGVPIGSELEYVDLGTIAHALIDRR